MEKIFILIVISTALIIGISSVTSFMGQTVSGAQHCEGDPIITSCTGGFGYGAGGTGGRFQIVGSTYTQSIGGGSASDPGGGGGHLVADLLTGESVQSGGNSNSDTCGGRTVCDASGNCQTTGKP
jgi:hypothetical protein